MSDLEKITPCDMARQMYSIIGQNFDEVLGDYFTHHYVHSTPDCLILARLHNTYWHVELAIGHNALRYFLELMPIYRPLVGWARELKNKPYQYYKTETLMRHL